MIYEVSDLVGCLNQTLEYAYPLIEVEGEVAEYKISQNKWVYFKIKDEFSSVDCFMTVWQLRVPIEEGMVVVVKANTKITKWGKFSLTVQAVRPSGEGSIKKSYEMLKAKLGKEGLFATERKRQLPLWPSNIAVISSVQAAGYVDFIKILNDRWVGVSVAVAQVQVQGESAADQIIRAIEYFNQLEQLPQSIVIVRGGGSASDLSTFNDERLARAVASSRVPVVVGVGHETDESLCDLVADVSASTPSNAAQIIFPDKNEVIRSVKYQTKSLAPRIESIISKHSLGNREMLARAIEKMEMKVDESLLNINNMQKLLNQLNPYTILTRGYAIVSGLQKVGQIIEIETRNNIMEVEVKNVSKK